MARSVVMEMKGNQDQNTKYCSKDGEFFEFGKAFKERARTDLDEVAEKLREGATLEGIMESDAGIKTIIRYPRGLQLARQLLAKPRNWETTNIWLYGSTGLSKSRIAKEISDKWCAKSTHPYNNKLWKGNGKLQWFCRYDSHEVVIIEDVRGHTGMEIRFLLELFDRYEYDVPTKGSEAKWAPKLIICTAKDTIEGTFGRRFENENEDIRQLTRRFKKEIEIKKDVDYNVYVNECMELIDSIWFNEK